MNMNTGRNLVLANYLNITCFRLCQYHNVIVVHFHKRSQYKHFLLKYQIDTFEEIFFLNNVRVKISFLESGYSRANK